jgi:hypothetical protein
MESWYTIGLVLDMLLYWICKAQIEQRALIDIA